MEQLEGRTRFSQRHRIELLVMLFFTIALMSIAGLPGIGYTATIETASRGVIGGTGLAEGTATRNVLVSGYINANFSPLLYPISYLTGSDSTFRKFQGAAEYWDYNGDQVKEAVTLGTLFTELVKNLPYFLVVGFSATQLAVKLVKVPMITRLLTKVQAQHVR